MDVQAIRGSGRVLYMVIVTESFDVEFEECRLRGPIWEADSRSVSHCPSACFTALATSDLSTGLPSRLPPAPTSFFKTSPMLIFS